jgi:hypothetical protein
MMFREFPAGSHLFDFRTRKPLGSTSRRDRRN